jgi:phospholipid transport system substrate-binding protein
MVALLLLVAGLAVAADTPRGVIEETTDQVIAVLADASLANGEKRQKIESIVAAHFNFTVLSRLVLARNWKQLSSAQQSEFVEEFRKHLSVTYGKNVEQYNNEKVVIAGEREESGGDWTVRTRIVRPAGEPILVDYRLRREDGKWMVIDVIIEGTSLVANFRSQFQDIISRNGVTGLLDLLRQKNAKGEALKS